MKVSKSSENFISLKNLLLQLQLTLELSQLQEILSAYSDLLFILTEYSFLFETFFKETPSFKNTHTKFKSSFSSPDPARDGWNWWGYCAGNPVMNTDPLGLAPYINGVYDGPYNHKQQLIFLIMEQVLGMFRNYWGIKI